MLGSLFSSKDEDALLLNNSKIIQTKYNNTPCSKITLKTGTTIQYEIFKTVTHPNILPILKLSNHSIYTKRITPFSVCLEKDKKLYNKCVILKIKDALEFLHESLKREHRVLSLESIFLEASGMPLLGNFEKSCMLGEINHDFEKLSSISMEIINTSLNDIDEDKESLDFVLKIDSQLLSTLKAEDKQALMNKILEFKEQIPTFSIKNVFNVFISDLEKESMKEYKIFVLEKLLSLNREYFFENKKSLFSVVDSTVRLFLLKIFTKEQNTNMPLDDIATDLSLGLRVKDKIIKNETIDFIFKNSFSTETMCYFLENMLLCTDSESISLICSYLYKFEQEGLSKPIYKLLYSFLLLSKSTPAVYLCLDKFYCSFDKVKISKEILPYLCGHLIEKDNQEQCFNLVEKIIKFLRDHKEETHSKEWSFKNISSIFNKKEDHKETFEKRVSKFTKEEANEWDGQEIL